MKSLVDLLNQSTPGNPLLSFELLPPLKGESVSNLFEVIEKLKKFNPSFINITTHSSKYVTPKNSALKEEKVKKRPGTISIAAAITHKYNLVTVPHIVCRGFTKYSTENTLLELSYLNINNLLVLRGDETNKFSFEKEKNFNESSLDLIKQINKINQGKLLNNKTINFKSSFVFGIGGYPEKHPDAKSLKEDVLYAKKKIDLGAKYIVTQFFFDNNYFFDYYRLCREVGINVPIIPGIKLLRTKKQIEVLPKIFHINIPRELKEKIDSAKDEEEIKEIGIQWCIKQCLELKKFKVPCIHFYTMSRVKDLEKVLEKITN